MNRPTILVLGAGYGGLTTVVNLQKQLGAQEADIVLVNKNDYHYETTWLHEAAAGTIAASKVCYDISNVVNRSKVSFVKATVQKINVQEKKVITTDGDMTYDYLVIGLGFEEETFGIPGLDKYAFALTDLHAARNVREHIEHQFASWSLDEEKDDSKLTFIVGGAGFTGIELLGELGNRIPTLCKEFDVPQEKVRIVCVEAASTVLPGFDEKLVEYAIAQLSKKGIEFSIGTPVVEATPDGVKIKVAEDKFEFVKARTVIWAAGVRGNHLIEMSGIENNRARVHVEKDMRAPGFDDVFVVGDCAAFFNEETGRPYPPTAQIAMQQAVVIAKNIVHLMNGEETVEFIPQLKGSVCSLGHDDAIGDALGRKLSGKSAAALKKIIDNRALFLIGGPKLVAKKGKFKFI